MLYSWLKALWRNPDRPDPNCDYIIWTFILRLPAFNSAGRVPNVCLRSEELAAVRRVPVRATGCDIGPATLHPLGWENWYNASLLRGNAR